MRAVHDGGAELDRLDRILPAMRHQRAAHEHDRRKTIEQAEFAHGVGDIDVRRRGRQFLARAQVHAQARCDNEARNRSATVGMPRHDHGEQPRKEPGERLVRFDQNLFLAGMGRGRNDHGTAARHRHQLFEFGVIGGRRLGAAAPRPGCRPVGIWALLRGGCRDLGGRHTRSRPVAASERAGGRGPNYRRQLRVGPFTRFRGSRRLNRREHENAWRWNPRIDCRGPFLCIAVGRMRGQPNHLRRVQSDG